MLSAFDQENLTVSHAITAVNKPLNQSIRALHPKTPGAGKALFRGLQDENAPLATIKGGKSFVTPVPRTARAPLGAKTTNAKAQAFQTPALKAPGGDLNRKKNSTVRRSVKKKIHVESESIIQAENIPAESERDEPDWGFAPPAAIPLPDPPLDFSEIDQSYPELRAGAYNRNFGQYYSRSPADEHGVSLSRKKQEEDNKRSLEQDLAHLEREPYESRVSMNTAPLRTQTTARNALAIPSARVNTLKARSAATMLSTLTQPRTHQRLPSVVTRETTASKQKRKPAFVVSQDPTSFQSTRAPIYSATIGFPKAKKPVSIIPSKRDADLTAPTQMPDHPSREGNKTLAPTTGQLISPRKFIQLHGEPEEETDTWLKLKELEIRDRRRMSPDHDSSSTDNIFDFEVDDDLDDQLAAHLYDFGAEGLQLSVDDL